MRKSWLRRWLLADRVLDRATLVVGLLMIAYMGTAVAGLVSSSARHYAAFTVFVMIIAAIASFKIFVGERLGRLYGEEGYEERDGEVLLQGEEAEARAEHVRLHVSPLVWAKGAAAALGSLLAIPGALYILMNADRLERTAPFFQGADMTVGGVFTVGVLILTLQHWGPTLTAIV